MPYLLLKRHHRTVSRQLVMESLENRLAPAGNVLATMVGGNLMIRGDGDDNGLHLMFNADGTVEVSGVDAGGGATTINGSDEPFVAANIRSLTRVNLGAGDDTLNVESEATVNGTANATTQAVQGPLPLDRVGRLQALRSELSDRLSGDFFARQRLLINVGQGTDTVDATVQSNLAVHLTGNSADDDVSIRTVADVDGALVAGIDLDVGSSQNQVANVSNDEAANLAVIGANSLKLSANAADTVFSDLDSPGQASLNTNFGAQAGLLGNVGMNDSLGNGALNSNINAGVSGAFQSQVGILPLG
jgi:hypothetical protein